MKLKKLSVLLFFLVLLGGCHSAIEADLDTLERRIEKIERRCQELNTTLQGIQSLLDNLQNYDFITGIEPVYDGSDIIGYTISFTHSDPVVLYNGTDAETPELGVAKGDDGVWYWTVKYPSDVFPSFITDNYGVRIPTDAGSPLLKIENGYWMVTYDGGDIWHNLGRATGEDGASFFESVTDKGDYIEFRLLNGTTIQVPTWASFEKLQENCRKTNENLEAFSRLAKTYSDKVYVQDMIPILNGTDTIGCRLQLSDGQAFSFYDGIGTNVPVIGARRASDDPDDNVWYWTIQYGNDPVQWILDEKGNRIQANAPDGLTPKISLKQVAGDDAWYWAVAYGDGDPAFLLCNGEKVKASVIAPETVVTSVVSVRDDIVCITLAGGLTVYIPMPKAITVTLKSPVTSKNTLPMSSGETVSFQCVVAGGDQHTDVLPLTDDYFYATATTTNHRTWTITVMAPTPFVAPSTSKLNLLVSNGYGQMKTIVITIQAR